MPTHIARRFPTTQPRFPADRGNAMYSGFTLADMATLLTALLPLFGIIGILCVPTFINSGPSAAILEQSMSKAFHGGIPGFAAAIIQTLSLMWLRTIINFQVKTGHSVRTAVPVLQNPLDVHFIESHSPCCRMLPAPLLSPSPNNHCYQPLL